MKYTFESRVRYSEIDHNGTMTLPALINYFQDCSTFQSEDMGLGLKALGKKHRAWLLSAWQVEILRYPKMGEKIEVGTFAYDFNKFIGSRNFFMKDEAGCYLAKANSLWVFMDVEKGRPTRATKEDIIAYGEEEPLPMEYESRKIEIPEGGVPQESFPVRRYHIDTNEHVNNCQYVQMALEMLPREATVHKLRVEYKKSAVYGDIICPVVVKDAKRTVVELNDTAGEAYAVVEMNNSVREK